LGEKQGAWNIDELDREIENMETMGKPLTIHDYIEIGLRRKWYILIPLVCSLLISFGVYKYIPKIYKATTLILVQPQRVPENYVRPTVTIPITERLNTISEEILSRTRLERIIREFNLHSEMRNKMPMGEIAEQMRKSIEVSVQSKFFRGPSQSAFTISFEGREPQTVMMVTNKLASLFIEENLKVRELQAGGTSEFLTKEIHNMEVKLKKKEDDIRDYKERFMGQLPWQLDANLRVLERLQEQLQTTNERIKVSEDRMTLLQGEIEQIQLKKSEKESLASRNPARMLEEAGKGSEEAGMEAGPEDPVISRWRQLKRDLNSARSKYTEDYPDVVDLKRRIANLEPKVMELLKEQDAMRETRLKERRSGGGEILPAPPVLNPAAEKLLTQYGNQVKANQLEIKRLKGETQNLKNQIALYQGRIEDTPKREQELGLLTRDYDLLKTNYQSLLDKRIQAQMAESLERRQQGEQFKILDPARLPEKPIRPDRNKILLIGAFIGMVAGVGLAWFRESMDESFHSESELETYLGLPVIASIPNLKEETTLSTKG
jgi:polysaccharide chain length determinant protein (PEP-CTERM system associated)